MSRLSTQNGERIMGAHYTNALVNHINKLNQQTIDRGAGVYTIGDFQLYLEREHERNMYKSQLGE